MLRLKYTKFDFGDFPRPAGGAYSAPQTLNLRGPTSEGRGMGQGGEGRENRGRRRRRGEGKGRRGKGKGREDWKGLPPLPKS